MWNEVINLPVASLTEQPPDVSCLVIRGLVPGQARLSSAPLCKAEVKSSFFLLGLQQETEFLYPRLRRVVMGTQWQKFLLGNKSKFLIRECNQMVMLQLVPRSLCTQTK